MIAIALLVLGIVVVLEGVCLSLYQRLARIRRDLRRLARAARREP